MARSKTTKRALVASACATLMCIAMLIGTTFAWFTDTASTSVNKIQSGTLDVELWQADANEKLGSSALTWVKAAGHTEEAVLWEPGATYNLESFRIKNNGNLALKYKVIISGIIGDAKLLDAIDFTVQVGDGTATTLANWDGKLTAGAVTDAITITGTMKTTAGNEYQDLAIDGIAITVVATQLASEYDSSSNDYDEDAQYPVYAVEDVAVDTNKKTTESTTITSDQKVGITENSLATATIPEGVLTTSESGATSLPMALSINEVETTSANFSVTVADTHVAKTLEVKMTNLSSENTTPIIIKMYVGTGLSDFKLYHNSTAMTEKSSTTDVTADQTYYYDSETGFVTMATATFSPFTYVYDASIATPQELAAATDTSAKTVTISNAKLLKAFGKAVNANNNSYIDYTITLTDDIDLGGSEWTPIKWTQLNVDPDKKKLTFNGNNKTISNFTVTAATAGETGTGFFGDATYVTIKGLTINKATATGYKYVAPLVAYGKCTTIENCHVTNSTVTANTWSTGSGYDGSEKVGAIAGSLNEGRNTVKNCTVTGCTIKGYCEVGGLIGRIVGDSSFPSFVTGNTVSNTTINWNNTNDYDHQDSESKYNVNEIVGENLNSGATVSDNTATDVTINR